MTSPQRCQTGPPRSASQGWRVAPPTAAPTDALGERDEPETAADIAAVAAMLEIADRLGIMHILQRGHAFDAATLAAAAKVPEQGAANYLEAAVAAGIVVETGDPGSFRAAKDFDERVYESGYLSWALNANRPFIEHAVEFLRAPQHAVARYWRDGRQVAVSSQWMGSQAFYPRVLTTILAARPGRVVDLGAGTARLLIEVLLAIPSCHAIAIDVDSGACHEAIISAGEAGVGPRLTVVERSIQSLAADPAPLWGADVIHAGFVFHDLMPDEESVANAVLRNCYEALRAGGIMAITEAVPYVMSEHERRFSAIVTYYHQQFMRRRLLTEEEWRAKLAGAGFDDIECIIHRFPAGRLFKARKH